MLAQLKKKRFNSLNTNGRLSLQKCITALTITRLREGKGIGSGKAGEGRGRGIGTKGSSSTLVYCLAKKLVPCRIETILNQFDPTQ